MSAEELVNLYFERIEAENINIGWKTKIFEEIKGHIVTGVPNETLEKAIREKGEKYSLLINQFRANKPLQHKDDLMKDGEFYFHPFLQVAPKPPMITINRDGTFTESYSTEEFFLKLKPSMTHDDVLSYFYSRFEYVFKNNKRDLGALKYLIETDIEQNIQYHDQIAMNTLDLILFTIDAAKFRTYDDDYKLRKGILDLKDYIDDALIIYIEKINYAKMNQLTFVQ